MLWLSLILGPLPTCQKARKGRVVCGLRKYSGQNRLPWPCCPWIAPYARVQLTTFDPRRAVQPRIQGQFPRPLYWQCKSAGWYLLAESIWGLDPKIRCGRRGRVPREHQPGAGTHPNPGPASSSGNPSIPWQAFFVFLKSESSQQGLSKLSLALTNPPRSTPSNTDSSCPQI